jgi:hypothetical protein
MNARCPKDRGSARGSSLITVVQGVALATARYVVSVQVNLLSLSLSLSRARARALSLSLQSCLSRGRMYAHELQ